MTDNVTLLTINRMCIAYGVSDAIRNNLIKYAIANEEEDAKNFLFAICADLCENHKEPTAEEFNWLSNFKPRNGDEYRLLVLQIYRENLSTMQCLSDIYEDTSSLDEFITKVSIAKVYSTILK